MSASFLANIAKAVLHSYVVVLIAPHKSIYTVGDVQLSGVEGILDRMLLRLPPRRQRSTIQTTPVTHNILSRHCNELTDLGSSDRLSVGSVIIVYFTIIATGLSLCYSQTLAACLLFQQVCRMLL